MNVVAYLRQLLVGPSVASSVESLRRQEAQAALQLYSTSRRGVHAAAKESPRVAGTTEGAIAGGTCNDRTR